MAQRTEATRILSVPNQQRENEAQPSFFSFSFLIGQGFKGHQLHDVLSSPGSADLTADVDFSYLRRMAGEGVACLGPVTQGTFLKNMGIDSRLQVSPMVRKKIIILIVKVSLAINKLGCFISYFSMFYIKIHLI